MTGERARTGLLGILLGGLRDLFTGDDLGDITGEWTLAGDKLSSL